MKMIFNLVLRLYGLIVVHLGSFNSNSIVYLFSDFFFGFLNNILFVWPLFGLSLKSILPETPYPGQSTEGYVMRESTVLVQYMTLSGPFLVLFIRPF